VEISAHRLERRSRTPSQCSLAIPRRSIDTLAAFTTSSRLTARWTSCSFRKRFIMRIDPVRAAGEIIIEDDVWMDADTACRGR
jgi:hypothetical protein